MDQAKIRKRAKKLFEKLPAFDKAPDSEDPNGQVARENGHRDATVISIGNHTAAARDQTG